MRVVFLPSLYFLFEKINLLRISSSSLLCNLINKSLVNGSLPNLSINLFIQSMPYLKVSSLLLIASELSISLSFNSSFSLAVILLAVLVMLQFVHVILRSFSP